MCFLNPFRRSKVKNTTSMLFAALTLSFAGNALGANYPNKTIELVVPYAPGGTTDLVARIVASELGEVLGEPVVVLNRPGAGGAVGSGYAARQKPDGYTLVMAVESSHAVNPNVQAEPMYDPRSEERRVREECRGQWQRAGCETNEL